MKSYIVAGLGFGDEGKGGIVDFLAETSGIQNTIRYTGGHQAAHYVTRNGIVHCFSQFGSSMFSQNTRTILSEHMVIEPFALDVEATVLAEKGVNDPYSRIYIDNNCLVVTPMHKILNQMKELVNRNGSCGCGVGETVLDSGRYRNYSLRAGDLPDPEKSSKKLDFLWRVKVDQAEQLSETNPATNEITEKSESIKNIDIDKLSEEYRNVSGKMVIEDVNRFFGEPSIYEGAQGTLLDVEHGFYPHVTKTTTTFRNAETICKTPHEKIGVFRPYITRHGVGPLPTEDTALGKTIPDTHNGYNEWQGHFRIGWQDLILMRYAVDISRPDYIAMTNVDRLDTLKKVKLCVSYEYSGNADVGRFFEYTKQGKTYHLQNIRKESIVGHGQEVNRILYDCKPRYQCFYKSDTLQWKGYFEFLESGEGMGVPIDILSYGPEFSDKKIVL